MFEISNAAKEYLQQLAADQADELIPHVTWGRNEGETADHWLFGFSGRDWLARLTPAQRSEHVWQVSGIEVIVDGPYHYLAQLQGALLDVIGGKLVFVRNGRPL